LGYDSNGITLGEDADQFPLLHDEQAANAVIDEQAQARDGLRRLYAALAKLTPEARTAYALYAIDGRSINEVAEITGSTKITAKTRIWRARREVERRAAADPVLAELLELGRESSNQ